MRVLFSFAVLAAAAWGPELVTAAPQDDYERLLEGRYTTALPVPDGGWTLRRGVASWTLESGSLRLQEPLADGTVTGLVFEGTGRFRMTIPDPVERAQWSRVAEKPDQTEIDEPFTDMVLRTSERFLTGLFELPDGAEYAPDKSARERHANWLEHRFVDADARIVCGRRVPGDEYLRVEVKTASFDWLTYQYDGLRQEEILLSRFAPLNTFVEHWVSLDRPEDRLDNGRPSRRRRPLIDLRHVDLEIDITRPGQSPRAGLNKIHPRRVRIRAEITFVPRVSGLRALPLTLNPWSEVTAVETADGESLEYLRHHVGGRSSILDNRLYDRSFVVLFESPLVAGEERRLVAVYDRELLNYAAGRDWYPGEGDGIRDPHTARLEITARKKDDVRAMGEPVEERQEDRTEVRAWSIARPTKMVTFSFAERFHEETLERDGLPTVIAFSAAKGKKHRTYRVADDVMSSLAYFQDLFASPLAAEQLYVTSIVGGHGQSFDGFIHLSERSFDEETEGPTQLFRAHEVAHQWWGHEVVWSSYRDQWLSEGFAEYSAMMFVESSMEKGEKYYGEIVRTYIGMMLGVVPPSRFARFPVESNDKQRRRIGPISVGYRASTATSLSGFTYQSYFKGALVLHMLRTLVRNRTGSDEAFVQVLRNFLEEHRGGLVSTQDFATALSRRVPMAGGWDWFFDQWVHDTAIPTYTWSYQVAPQPDADGRYLLELEVEQSEVSAAFRMPVPVRVELGRDSEEQVVVMVDEPMETLTVPLSGKPKKVIFNPDGAVVARVRRR